MTNPVLGRVLYKIRQQALPDASLSNCKPLTGAGAESRDSTLGANQIHGRHNHIPAAERV